jgi:hypothetical protein
LRLGRFRIYPDNVYASMPMESYLEKFKTKKLLLGDAVTDFNGIFLPEQTLLSSSDA